MVRAFLPPLAALAAVVPVLAVLADVATGQTVIGSGCPGIANFQVQSFGPAQLGATLLLTTTAGVPPVEIWAFGGQLPLPMLLPNPGPTPAGHPLVCCPQAPLLYVDPFVTRFVFAGAPNFLPIPNDPFLIGLEICAEAAVGDPNV